jgi:hypothetical protein
MPLGQDERLAPPFGRVPKGSRAHGGVRVSGEGAMIEQAEARRSAPRAADVDSIYREGIAAGLLGAATIALWFLILDTVAGRPFHTPTILGTALFRGGQGLASPETVPVSFEMVMFYTWIHALVFCVIGGIAARLLAVAERQPNAGFGILLLFVFFEFGFLAVTLLFAEPVLQALTWPAILGGNLLAALVMGAYFWRRHPGLQIFP